MSVTRGKFLKELGKSLPGMVLGGGVAAAGHKLLHKITAISAMGEQTPAVARPQVKNAVAREAEHDFIRSGPATGKRIALTFDDGPTPGVTERILDALKERQARATFFMIGRCLAAAPDLARRVLAEGHEVANHTLSHPKLTALADNEVQREIGETQDLMEKLLDHRPVWFRPPYGEFRRSQAEITKRAGLGVVLWNVDTVDWSQPGVEKILSATWNGAKPGSIILCHDRHAQTADAMGRMLDGLLERGLELATLSDVLVSA